VEVVAADALAADAPAAGDLEADVPAAAVAVAVAQEDSKHRNNSFIES
jgi:hypothetical protein